MIRNQRIWWVMMALVMFSLVFAGCKVMQGGAKPSQGEVAVGTARPRTTSILNDEDLATAVGTALIAEHLGWGENLVTVVMRDAHLGLEDVVALFVLLELAKSQDIDSVITLRQQGLGWGQVAHRLGIQPGVFNQLRVRILGPGGKKEGWRWENDRDFRDGLFVIFLSDQFGIIAPILRERFEGGVVMPDLMLALFLGRRSGRDWSELLKERKGKQETWLGMSNRVGVDLSPLDRIAQEVKQPPKAERGWKGQGKGQAKGQEQGRQAKGQEQGQAKGQEQGQGKGQEQGQAKGQEQGQAKGQEQGQGKGQEQGHGSGKGKARN